MNDSHSVPSSPPGPFPDFGSPRRVLLRIAEVAEILNVCQRTVRRLVDRQKLPRVRAFRHVLIPKEAVARFLAENTDRQR